MRRMILMVIAGHTGTSAKNDTTVPLVSPPDPATKGKPHIKIQWGFNGEQRLEAKMTVQTRGDQRSIN